MQAYSAWTPIPPGFACCALLLLSQSIRSLVLHGGGLRVLKLCPACVWSPWLWCPVCPVGNRSPAEPWAVASHRWHVIANGSCRLCSEKPAWAVGGSDCGAAVSEDPRESKQRWVRAWHQPWAPPWSCLLSLGISLGLQEETNTLEAKTPRQGKENRVAPTSSN